MADEIDGSGFNEVVGERGHARSPRMRDRMTASNERSASVMQTALLRRSQTTFSNARKQASDLACRTCFAKQPTLYLGAALSP